MKVIRDKISITINQLYEELDKSLDLKKELDYDTEFPELVINETRIKILKEFIQIFKVLKKNITANVNMLNLSKRLKLHFSQLKKVGTVNYKSNIEYFTTLLKVGYSLMKFKT